MAQPVRRVESSRRPPHRARSPVRPDARHGVSATPSVVIHTHDFSDYAAAASAERRSASIAAPVSPPHPTSCEPAAPSSRLTMTYAFASPPLMKPPHIRIEPLSL